MTRRSGGRWRLITAEQDEHLLPSSSNTTISVSAIVNSSNFLDLPLAFYNYLCNILIPTSLSPAEAVLQKCSSIKPVRPAPPPREQVRLTLTYYCAAAWTKGLCLYPHSHPHLPQILEGGHSWEPGLQLSLASLYGLSAEEALHLSNRQFCFVKILNLENQPCLLVTDMEMLGQV